MTEPKIASPAAAAGARGQRILVVGPSWVGDMVMAQTLFKLLKAEDPDALIDVLAPAWSAPILARMPEVRDAVGMPVGHGRFGFGVRFRLGRKLRPAAYERAIVLPRSWKSALAPFFARIPTRTGFRGEMRHGLLTDLRELDRSVLDQTVKRFAALAVPRGAPLPNLPEPRLTIDRDNRDRLVDRLRLDRGGAIALMPGAAFGPAKCWPIGYFAELTAELAATGHQVWILGSDSEHETGEAIRARAGSLAVNLCGKTRLEDTVDLLSAAAVAVCNDSGLMHVAAAAGTHVLAIYGSSSPAYTPPLTRRKTILYQNLECSPCFQRECPLQHLDCLKSITPERALAGVRDALEVTAL